MIPSRALLAGLACLMLIAAGARLAAEDDEPAPAVVPGGKAVVSHGIATSLTTRLLFPRPQAPLPVAVTLACDSDAPRAGQLLLTVVDGHETLFSWLSPEWTLTRSPRTVDALLPPLPIDESHGELEARLEWREGSTRVAFDALPLCGQGREERPLAVALCVGAGIDAHALMSECALDRFLAVPGGSSWRPDVRTVPVRLGEAELPAHALSWCAYDLAIVAGERFARLKEKQLAALERWTRGGGSLLVAPEGPLGEESSAFLRRLGVDDAETLVDQAGRLDASGAWPRLLRPGLGRAVVAPLSDALDPARQQAYAALPAFLWKLRAEPAARLARGEGCDFEALGKTDRETRERELANPYYNSQAGVKSGEERPSFRALRLPLSGSLTNLLLPSRVTIIPFSVVLLVFGAFVLAVGPGDWFVLGWLRARRFTWVVFPLVAVAFTLLMVRLSRHYLGGADHRQRLEIVDCGAGGEVLRDAAVELVFSGHRGEVASDVHDALWADLGRGESEEQQYGYYRQQRDTQSVDAVPGYDGSFPGHYRIAQQVGQWDPRLRRTLSFEAPEGLPLRLDRPLRLADVPAYAAELVKAHGPLFVATWRNGAMTVASGAVEDLAERERAGRMANGRRDWLGWMCASPAAGWFSLAAQVSPRGGATYEDLPVHDASDPSQWLLVVGRREGQRTWLIRRLYRESGLGAAGKGASE